MTKLNKLIMLDSDISVGRVENGILKEKIVKGTNKLRVVTPKLIKEIENRIK